MSLKKFAPWKIQADDRFKLSDIPTRLPASQGQVDEAKWLKSLFERLNKMQTTLYAAKTHGLLLVLQGMDTAGKDGVIRHVFTHISPLGVRAQAFAAPTEEEMRHDFLWRIHSKLPAKGEMVIFNRSHYEDVLVPQVRGLLKPAMIEKRLAHIRNFEALLEDEGITVLKCFLHISKTEQKKRLQARLEDPQKQWKLQASDFEDRKLWPTTSASKAMAIQMALLFASMNLSTRSSMLGGVGGGKSDISWPWQPTRWHPQCRNARRGEYRAPDGTGHRP